MRIGKPLALFIGIVTIWPAIYMLLFMGFFVWMAFTIIGRQPSQDPGFFPYIVIPHVGTMLVMFVLAAFYIIHVFKNTELKDDRRVLWAIVLFMGCQFQRLYTGGCTYGHERTVCEPSNQAMQLTASKLAVRAWSVCRRERMLRGMDRGLAAADLVSR